MTDLNAETLAGLCAAATPDEWSIWREPITNADEAKAELACQVDHTDQMIDAVVMLNSGGLCPALTGYGPTADANAALIAYLCSERNRNAILAMLREREADKARIAELEGEVARLVQESLPQWFYPEDGGEVACFSPEEVIDYYHDGLPPGDHVIEISCATPRPSIWCVVHIHTDAEMDALETDDRMTITEHAHPDAARAALSETE